MPIYLHHSIYTHLDFQHLARVYDETHPRAKKDK
jgi:integrase/recombinase XerC